MSGLNQQRVDYQRSQMSLGEQLDDLARRVAEIEKGKTKVEMCPNNEGIPKSMCGSCSEEMHGSRAAVPYGDGTRDMRISRTELARLRRVEEAAREFANHTKGVGGMAPWDDCCESRRDALRAALDSEPKR